MRTVRREPPPSQPMPMAPGADATTVRAPLIQALIPLGLRAVEEALQAEVTPLAGPLYAREATPSGVVRWGTQPGSVYLADQKLPIAVPRVRESAPWRCRWRRTRRCRPRAARMWGSFAACWAGSPVGSTKPPPPCPKRLAWRGPVCRGGSSGPVPGRFSGSKSAGIDDAEWLVLVLDGKLPR